MLLFDFTKNKFQNYFLRTYLPHLLFPRNLSGEFEESIVQRTTATVTKERCQCSSCVAMQANQVSVNSRMLRSRCVTSTSGTTTDLPMKHCAPCCCKHCIPAGFRVSASNKMSTSLLNRSSADASILQSTTSAVCSFAGSTSDVVVNSFLIVITCLYTVLSTCSSAVCTSFRGIFNYSVSAMRVCCLASSTLACWLYSNGAQLGSGMYARLVNVFSGRMTITASRGNYDQNNSTLVNSTSTRHTTTTTTSTTATSTSLGSKMAGTATLSSQFTSMPQPTPIPSDNVKKPLRSGSKKSYQFFTSTPVIPDTRSRRSVIARTMPTADKISDSGIDVASTSFVSRKYSI